MTSLGEVFENKKGLFMPYMMGGDPDLETSFRYLMALIEGGADIIELGVPFSDPIADGPVIQEAANRALQSGTTPLAVIDLVRRTREAGHKTPIVLMTYYNLIHQMGEDDFCRELDEAGASGMIVPDLPLEEAQSLKAMARQYDLDLVMLASPATSDERAARIAEFTGGFLYLVSSYGTTGERDLGEAAADLIKRYAPLVGDRRVGLAVGFGIGTPEHVRMVLDAGAQGAIVGSALVRRIGAGDSPEQVSELVKSLADEAHR